MLSQRWDYIATILLNVTSHRCHNIVNWQLKNDNCHFQRTSNVNTTSFTWWQRCDNVFVLAGWDPLWYTLSCFSTNDLTIYFGTSSGLTFVCLPYLHQTKSNFPQLLLLRNQKMNLKHNFFIYIYFKDKLHISEVATKRCS